jgi:hypothetical protein
VPGVGVAALCQNLRGRAGFHDLACLHHGDAVGHVGHHGKVMGDQQQRQPILGHEGLEQVEDLGLRRDVERGRGLVCDQQAGFSAMAAAMQTRWRWPPDSSCG